MDLESLATHEGFDFLKTAIRSTYGKARRRRLIAEAIRELLALDPDIDAVDARMRAAKAPGIPSDALELRARLALAPMDDAAKAKAEEAKAKAADAAKKEAELLAKAQDRVAERYKKSHGKEAAAKSAKK